MTTELLNPNAMTASRFWTMITNEAENAAATLADLYPKAQQRALSQEEAIQCLNALFIDSHVRIRALGLGSFYPTKQYYPDILKDLSALWWVDHFTAGCNVKGTLTWFSSQKVLKNNHLGYAGASAHFVIGYSEMPFYIIPITCGGWHEPRRNRDSVAVEMVNVGAVQKIDGVYYYNNGRIKIPADLVQALPPVSLNPPFRGAQRMQPFTTSQILHNLTLKRLVIAALPGKMDITRMSAHTDWREGKQDTGPLFPFRDVNLSAFEFLPIKEYSFIQNYTASMLDVTNHEALYAYDESKVDNPAYDPTAVPVDNTPTTDKDPEAGLPMPSMEDIFKTLNAMGYPIKSTVFDAAAKEQVFRFQQNWNKSHDDQLKEDGIPGPKTYAAIAQASSSPATLQTLTNNLRS